MVNDFVFRAYVMNQDLVKEGYPAGEWVDFPIKHDADIDLKEAVNEVLCRIRLDGMRYNQYLIESQSERLADFIKMLKAQDGSISDFDGSLWGGMVEFVTVGRGKQITVTFRDGTEILA